MCEEQGWVCLVCLPCISLGEGSGLAWPSSSAVFFFPLLTWLSQLLPSSAPLTPDLLSASTRMMWPVLLLWLSSVLSASPRFSTEISSFSFPVLWSLSTEVVSSLLPWPLLSSTNSVLLRLSFTSVRCPLLLWSLLLLWWSSVSSWLSSMSVELPSGALWSLPKLLVGSPLVVSVPVS